MGRPTVAAMDDKRLTLAVLAVFAVAVTAEWWRYRVDQRRGRRRGRGYERADTRTSLGIAVLFNLTKPISKAYTGIAVFLAAAVTPLALPVDSWWVWVLAVVAVDFTYYWHHRLAHRVRVLWTAHSVHHSSQYFNLTTATRLPFLSPATALASLVYVPVALSGIPLVAILAAQMLGLLFQYPLHTERIGKLWRPIEFVFNTPSHHRVHHGSNNPYLDKNYAAIFVLWDRCFGTYAEELGPVKFGLTTNIETHNIFRANYHELAKLAADMKAARSWGDRLNYLIRPPGWAPGSPTSHAPEAEIGAPSERLVRR